MESSTLLVERCAALRNRICNLAQLVRRMVEDKTDTELSVDTWREHGLTAAFLAFVEVGGDSTDPDGIDWQSPELLRVALRVLQKQVLGSESDVYDVLMRERTRKVGSRVTALGWDAWTEVSLADDLGHTREHDGHISAAGSDVDAVAYRYQDFVAEHTRPQLDDTFAFELTRLLRPQEAVWLIRRYRDGEPTSVLAHELVQRDAKYQTADGFARATTYIDVVVHRAKKKARRVLDSGWRDLALEVA